MSQVYASEPPTSGRVIFDTTHGPLEISLWCRECPHTTRFFVQLCLDGFYDQVLFHRILPNTLLQCGALRSTTAATTDAVGLETNRNEWETYRQSTQAGTALERRPYELHSRLRFSHRGLVAMALSTETADDLTDDDLIQQQVQFFVTLEATPHLDGKHVVFGTVSGPTIFNALRMGRIEVDEETGQPVAMDEAPRIKSVKIVENPIHTQLVPQRTVPWREVGAETTKKVKKKKRKGKLDTNVLSFGDELDEHGVESGSLVRPSKKSKPGSSTSSSMANENGKEATRGDEEFEEEKPKRSPPQLTLDDHEEKPSKLAYTSRLHKDSTFKNEEKPPPEPAAHPPSPEEAAPRSRRKPSAMEARRAKYAAQKKGGKKKKYKQEDTMEKLLAFQGRVKDTVVASKNQGESALEQDNSLAARMARRAAQETDEKANRDAVESYHGQILEGMDEDKLDYQQSSNWMATTFKCKRHIDHTAGSDGRKADDYEVVDDQVEPSHKEKRRKHHRHHHQKHS